MTRICREHSLTDALALTTNASTTRGFVMGQDAGGILYCLSAGANGTVSSPIVNTDVTISFLVDPDDSGTRYVLRDANNANVTMAIRGGNCYPLPDALFGAGKVLIQTTSNPAIVRIGLKT